MHRTRFSRARNAAAEGLPPTHGDKYMAKIAAERIVGPVCRHAPPAFPAEASPTRG
jgi:hypothetical protein